MAKRKVIASSLHINDQSTWRGGEQQVYYLLKGLKDRGHLAELVTQKASALGERARAMGVSVHPIQMRGEADLLAARRLAKLIFGKPFSIVHMHTAHAHSLGCLACAVNSRPICIVSRRVINPIKKNFFLPARLKYKWRVNHYIAISKAVKDVLVSGGVDERKISIVYSGVEPQSDVGSRDDMRRSLGLPGQAKVIGTVGALADHKGQRFLVEAAPLVVRERPSTKFVIVGDGELRGFLRDLASQLGVDNAIIFTGFQPNPYRYISACDVFVAPSLMEGLNTSILDALMLGRPVIATTVGGIPEIIEDGKTGLLVPPGNPRALAAAIVDLLRDPEKAERLALAGHRKAIEEFTAERMVEGTIAVYERLLQERCKS